LPSYTENFGVVIAEALSQSVPVITTKGTPWSVLPKIAAGWWINNDVSSLSLILDTATKKSSLELFEMGSRGRTYVENHFSQDCIAKKLSFFYSKVKKDL
jgi:glycosyltransferase involved in cell wall biosynthesis